MTVLKNASFYSPTLSGLDLVSSKHALKAQ